MTLHNITVADPGEAELLSIGLADGSNLIKTSRADEIFYALGVVLNHKDIPPPPSKSVREGTRIEAEISIGERRYKIIARRDEKSGRHLLRAYDESLRDVTGEYLYLTDHPTEQDRADIFIGGERKMPLRILQYADEELYFSRGELARLTSGASGLRAFRAYLRRFIELSLPEVIRVGKQYEIILDGGGHSVRCRGDGGEDVRLSESEQMLLRYLCFLRSAEFWRGFEELRNLNGVCKPLIVRDLLEGLDESVDTAELMERTARLSRQSIILTG